MHISSNLDPVWQNSPRQSSLAHKQVHIWRANLDLPPAEIDQLFSFLSADEIDRANRFHFAKDKRRFIVARGSLRQLLANYLQISANSIEFEYSDRGKPRLAKSMGDNSLQFNISHSQEYALLGFIKNHAIGVDLEYLREMKDMAKIAERFFSPQESKLIANCHPEKQQRVFFQLWTAKEAFLKATGLGLGGSLDSVVISLDQVACPSLLSIENNIAAVNNWSMYSCIPALNYVATVAIECPKSQLKIDYWNLSK